MGAVGDAPLDVELGRRADGSPDFGAPAVAVDPARSAASFGFWTSSATRTVTEDVSGGSSGSLPGTSGAATTTDAPGEETT